MSSIGIAVGAAVVNLLLFSANTPIMIKYFCKVLPKLPNHCVLMIIIFEVLLGLRALNWVSILANFANDNF